MIPAVAAILKFAPLLIEPTIRVVETLFGPKTGETKARAVFDAVKPVLESLGTSGKLQAAVSDDELRTVIETVFQKMKADGDLVRKPVSEAISETNHQIIYIPPGARVISIQFSTE